eukprot:365219-Chlamydomonas_euryale.AAC.17
MGSCVGACVKRLCRGGGVDAESVHRAAAAHLVRGKGQDDLPVVVLVLHDEEFALHAHAQHLERLQRRAEAKRVNRYRVGRRRRATFPFGKLAQ